MPVFIVKMLNLLQCFLYATNNKQETNQDGFHGGKELPFWIIINDLKRETFPLFHHVMTDAFCFYLANV